MRVSDCPISRRAATTPYTAAYSFSSNTFYGDAGGNMSDHSKGGNDTFTGDSILHQHVLR